ncbi:MAG: DNA-directed RNA polymerase subunit alpha C-terminal domain-containing protein [Chloroflexota bacterium]
MRRLQKQQEIQTTVEETRQRHTPENYSVEEMELGTRATKALVEANLITVGDVAVLLEKSDDALLAVPGIGQKALIDIKRYLRSQGLFA